MTDTGIHPNGVRHVIHLPNELLAIIINEIASDYRTLANLASCRLVSHIFRSLATPFFFSSIRLTDNHSPSSYESRIIAIRKRAANLEQILTVHDIAVLVHTLTVRWPKSDLLSRRNGTVVSNLIHRLPYLRHFTLESVTLSVEFFLLSRDFSSAIQALCRSPHLRTLDLRYIYNFPLAAITSCPNLHQLCLTGVTFRVNLILPTIFPMANPTL